MKVVLLFPYPYKKIILRQTKLILEINKSYVPTPLDAFEKLFFALFGLSTPESIKMNSHLQPWTLQIFKLVFGFYLLMAAIVLINLLIAMMSDTYQRIQVIKNRQ